jgi:hypothetical protein
VLDTSLSIEPCACPSLHLLPRCCLAYPHYRAPPGYDSSADLCRKHLGPSPEGHQASHQFLPPPAADRPPRALAIVAQIEPSATAHGPICGIRRRAKVDRIRPQASIRPATACSVCNSGKPKRESAQHRRPGASGAPRQQGACSRN